MSISPIGRLVKVSGSRSRPVGRWSLQRKKSHVGRTGLMAKLRQSPIFAMKKGLISRERNLKGGPIRRNLRRLSCLKEILSKKEIGTLPLRVKERAYFLAKHFVTSRRRMGGRIARARDKQVHSNLCQPSSSRPHSAAGREIPNQRRQALRSGCILFTRTHTEETKTENAESSPNKKSLRSAAGHFPRQTIKPCASGSLIGVLCTME